MLPAMRPNFTFTPDPRRPYQISDSGVLALFRPRTAPHAGPHQGVLCVVSWCVDQNGPSQDAMLTVYPIDDRLTSVRREGDKMTFSWDKERLGQDDPPSRQSFRLGVDWSLATARFLSDATPTPEDEDLRDFIERRLNAEILNWFYEGWLAARGLAPNTEPDADLSGWEPGTMLTARQAFPKVRPDRYQLDGTIYLADDAHCVDPRCDCRDVRILFLEEQAPDRYAEVGVVIAEMPGGTPVRWDPYRLDIERLRRLFALYKARHGDLRDVGLMTTRLREIGKEVYQVHTPRPAVAGPKIGRNDPCPCGSGKKYKRCCQPRPAPPPAA